MNTDAPAREPATARRWLALVLIATAQFMVIMDTSIIGVALPEMRDDLGFAPADLSWVFNAYVVAFGGLLLLGGRLSDLYGARRMFSTGWVILALGSLVAGLANDAAIELVGRAVQGTGAALIAPASLTLLFTVFGSEPKELTKALALYGAAAPAGGTAGVFLGGVLTEYASWPWVFFVNIPIAVVILIATPRVMPAGTARRGRVDLAGAVTVTTGLGAVVFAVVSAPEAGWLDGITVGVGASGLVLLAAFVALQARLRQPLMRLGIFRTSDLAAANSAQFLLGAAWIPMFFFLNLYLQQVLGLGPFASGAALLPLTVTIMVGMVGAAPRLIARFGPKATTVAGLGTLAAGLGWLSMVRPDGTFAVDVLPASLLTAAGMAMAFIPSLGTALSAAAPEEGGLAAGIVNTSYQIGSALGLAAMTAVAAAYGADEVGNPVALTDGFSAGLIGAAGIAAAGALIAALTLRTARPAAPASSPRGDHAPVRLAAFTLALVAVSAMAFAAGAVTDDSSKKGAAMEQGVESGVEHGGKHGEAETPATPAPAPAASTLPGLSVSDRGYTLLLEDDTLAAGENVEVAFTISGPDGLPVREYRPTHDQEMHLVVVRRDLASFQHLHPERDENGRWAVPVDLPVGGSYRMYADFAPAALADGTLVLGSDSSVAGEFDPEDLPSATDAFTVEDYEITLDGAPSAGVESELVFTVNRAGNPVADLEPYLAAFGHLVSLRGGDLAYLHTHPAQDAASGFSGGPLLRFATTFPTAGSYRLFLNFAHAGQVRTAAFTVDVPEPSVAGATPPPIAVPSGGEHSGH